MRIFRILLVIVAVLALGAMSFAAEFFVVKNKAGKMIIIESRPTDPEFVIIEGPFPSRTEADVIIQRGGAVLTPGTPGAQPVPPGALPPKAK